MNTRTEGDTGTNKLPLELWISPAVFVMLVMMGSAYVVFAKTRGYDQIYVTFAPVFIMIVYAALMLFGRLLRLRDDQAGDNIYYMGFLFTLTSLGASLYQFNASGDSEYIVRNFGIAIASTIAGIAGRVLFNQMRRDPIEVERVARLELAEASRRVRAELDQTVIEFNHFRRGALQSLQEGFAEVKIRVGEVSGQILADLEEVTEKSAGPLERAGQRSGETIGAVTKTMTAALEGSAKRLSEETERLSKSATAISDSLDGVSGRLAAMQAPDEIIKIKLEPTVKGIANAVDRFSKRLDAHEQIIQATMENARKSAEFASRTREEAAAAESRMREAVSGCVQAAKEFSAATVSFSTAAGAQSGRVEAILLRTDATLAALKDMTAAASEREGRHADTISRLLSAIEQVAPATELTVARPTPSPTEPKRGLWRFGTNA